MWLSPTWAPGIYIYVCGDIDLRAAATLLIGLQRHTHMPALTRAGPKVLPTVTISQTGLTELESRMTSLIADSLIRRDPL